MPEISFLVSILRGSVGADLQDLAKDRAILTDPDETRRRRTIRLTRQHLRASWGFTLQTYGIRNKKTGEVEVMSYVDYVEINGPAWLAGMKKGDVILSVNGESVDMCTHRDLVTKIQRGGRELRLVVLFEDCCKKVELQERYIKLKKLLNLKLKELRRLEGEESRLLRGGSLHKPLSSQTNGEIYSSAPSLLSRLSALRQSAISNCSAHSSGSSDWDRYSEITSPLSFEDLPVNRFAFDGSMSDVSNISSAHEVSLSSSSDSQSELQADADLACDTRPVFVVSEDPSPNRHARRKRSCEGQNGDDESELDTSYASGPGDGDTDSQTSFLSPSESSPRVSSLSEILARDESFKSPEQPSAEDRGFRQMYTVARWVGMNTGSKRRHSCDPTGRIETSKQPSSGLNGLKEMGKARSLSSVNEIGEEGANNGKDSFIGEEGANNGQTTAGVAASGRREGLEGIRSNSSNSSNSNSNSATLTAAADHELVSRPDFHYESDSEDSSVLSDDLSRNRRNTIIHVGQIPNSPDSDTTADIKDFDTSDTSRSAESVHAAGSVSDVVAKPDNTSQSSSFSKDNEEKDPIPAFGTKDTRANGEGITHSQPKDTENSSCPNSRPVRSDAQAIGSEDANPSLESSSIGDRLSSEPNSKTPSYLDGILVNDVTCVTKL
ncbi:general receptor for phosphoinositides 1-associated scaffold protein [Plakobranchus ocellatus]|uniref:General receptor for phosphoinositides 1-associated scaffold protein n=1 Tax=Plakobranchus ocellatus TaxID=259542 RepID=A0AAV3Z4J8_9GAST|nr:general receptor for phosphoinositides 1-associated scaffold protein [Plakobranchus ocellatus]